MQRTAQDFWIEMSIREIWTQCHFAEAAFRNLEPKAAINTDIVFSSIHSFLSHCAMVSKLLKAKAQGTKIADILHIPSSSEVHNRTARNHLDHYDEKLKNWIRKIGTRRSIGTYNIGPKSVLPDIIYISHYDPTTATFTFINQRLDLKKLFNEV